MKKIIKFMLYKYVIFIKYIYEINDHNKICFFISHTSDSYFMKNMSPSALDDLREKYENLKINMECKIHLPHLY